MDRTRFLAGSIVSFGLLALAAALSGARVPADAQEPSGCRVTTRKVAAPGQVYVQDPVTVTLSLDAECPPEPAPVDVMLVLDVSSSMANERKLVNAKLAAHAFMDAMELDQSRVGLVTFNQGAAVRSRLVGRDGEDAIRDAIDGLIAGGETNISAAIELARVVLAEDDRGDAQAMIVLSDGYNTASGAEPVPAAAARAKAAGVTVATVCAGGDCDPGLEQAASSPQLYFNVPDTAELAELYRWLASSLQANEIATLTVRDEIPDNFRYIDGSAVPAPARVGPAPGAFLEWDFADVLPSAGIAYRLIALEPGTHPTNIVAVGRYSDRRSRTGEAIFPVPEVVVIAPPCIERGLDLYFLIDDSNCLAGAEFEGLPSLEAIEMGVAGVLEQMDMGRDRAAVIAIGDTAVLLQSLTADPEAVLAAVRLVAMRDDSARLDLGYGKVRKENSGPLARSRAQVVTLFVTDGPIMPQLEMAEQQARVLRTEGVLHYGIGIGDLAQHGSLRKICESGGYRELDFGGDLIGAFRALGAIVAPFGDLCLPPEAPTPTVAPRVTPTPEPLISSYLPVARR